MSEETKAAIRRCAEIATGKSVTDKAQASLDTEEQWIVDIIQDELRAEFPEAFDA